MKILVIGSGGREHALAHTFWRQGHVVYCHPGNPGIRQISEKKPWSDDYRRLALEAKEEKIDLTVVGPESHLEKGIQEVFADHNLLLFGPSSHAARMESSKAFAKQFMKKHKIPSANFEVCTTSGSAELAVKSLFQKELGVVVKASGLAAGKGVFCCQSYEEANRAIRQILEDKIFGIAGSEIVVEECLSGPEISFQTLCDGKRIVPLLPSQDHKRLHDFDLGPNTGGMGAYAPLPFLSREMMDKIEKTIVEPTLLGLQKEQILYQGLLYFGVMITKEGPKVLEYNCRFGDPETQAILPLLETDLAKLMMDCVQGNLTIGSIRWKPKASCCVVLASKGYPFSHTTGYPIEKFEETENLLVFHGGTAFDKRGRHVTAGGRVLGVTALGKDLNEAIEHAYEAISEISCSWAHFRRDIGRAALSTAT